LRKAYQCLVWLCVAALVRRFRGALGVAAALDFAAAFGWGGAFTVGIAWGSAMALTTALCRRRIAVAATLVHQPATVLAQVNMRLRGDPRIVVFSADGCCTARTLARAKSVPPP
jgi:hypothetical protein